MGHGGRDGVVEQALHVGYVDPAVVDQYPVRGADPGGRSSPMIAGIPAGGARHRARRPPAGRSTASSTDSTSARGTEAGVTAPYVQPQAAVDLVEALNWIGVPSSMLVPGIGAPPQLGPGERDVDLLDLEPDASGQSGPRFGDECCWNNGG